MDVVIAVSGLPGAGKTTYAKYLARKLNLRYVSNGELFRKLAKELGISLEEMHKLAETNPQYDRMVDERAREEALRGNVVIDGHLAAWLLRSVADLCIVFTAPLEVRARRISERDGVTFEEALNQIRWREESNRRRALALYKIDISDWRIVDLVINTAQLNVDGVKKVLDVFINEWSKTV